MIQRELMTAMDQTDSPVNQRSSPHAKIALFRSLFRGRDDVYSRHFVNRKTGKSGYQIACANLWVRGVCEKPRIRCNACPNRRCLPVTDEVIRGHLSGQDGSGSDFAVAVYPMLQDETCFFLVAEFGKAPWREDAAALMETGRLLNVSLALEQSRTGQAGRIWMFFEQAIPASLARQFGSHLLTETMERRPAIGLDSYDGLFPNQDTLPHNSCGSPVPLPLEKQARACGNSVFLDDHLKPLADQWTFLGGIRKISRAEVEDRVRDAQRRDRIVGVRFPPAEEKGVAAWAVPPSRRHKAPPILGAPLPPTLELIVGNEISIARETVPAALHNRLLRLAAFQNPEY
jgi:hypothetical protein